MQIKGRISLVGATLLVAGVGSGCISGYAASADPVIDACALEQNGSLRVLAPGGSCRVGERPIQLATPPAPTGISKAVHGSVGFEDKTSGSGFTVEHEANTGFYKIIFDAPFDVAPHCLASAEFFAPCVATNAAEDELVVECNLYTISESAEGPVITIRRIDQPFQFLCVQE